MILIFEGIYDDGELFRYKRVSEETENTWRVNDRINQGEYNTGETWEYTKSSEFIKDFNLNDVKEKQIISVENFLASRDELLLSYYHGNTSNNKYNDNTGDAYLAEYKENGDIRYLYVGSMKYGLPHDNSGYAWAISWGYDDDGYYYYQGTFDKGKHAVPKNWKPMTQEEINSILDSNEYTCSLQGLI